MGSEMCIRDSFRAVRLLYGHHFVLVFFGLLNCLNQNFVLDDLLHHSLVTLRLMFAVCVVCVGGEALPLILRSREVHVL